MKKKLAVMLALCMTLTMVSACGKKDQKDNKEQESTATQEEGSEEETGTESGEEGESSTTDEPSLAGCDISKYITLGSYKGMDVPVAAPQEVTDEKALEYLMANEFSSLAEEIEIVDRAAMEGDKVTFACVGTIDGVAFEGGSSGENDWDVVLGSGRMIPGFEEGIVGMELDETKDVVCSFPEDYGVDDLNGKEAVFTITLHKITVTEYPELTDELLVEKELGYETVEEAVEKTKERLTESVMANYKNEVENAILAAMLDNCTFIEEPAFLVDKNYLALRQNIESYAAMFGVSFGDFLGQYYGMTEEEFEAEANAVAISAAQESLGLEAVAQAEGIRDISSEELMQEAEAYVAENSMSFPTVDALFESVTEEEFRDYIIAQRVIAWLVENNNVVDK